MKKPLVAAGVALVLALAGGATAFAVAGGSPEPVASDTARVAAGSTAVEPEAPAEGVSDDASDQQKAPTGAGEVCDPHNLNDGLCLAFYPDAAVVNMTSGVRAQEPMRSMSASAKIALAREACSVFEAGGSAQSTTLVATNLDDDAVAAQIPADLNNANIFMVGSLAYCPDFAGAEAETILWTINAYRGMGEQAALDSFADGQVIQRP